MEEQVDHKKASALAPLEDNQVAPTTITEVAPPAVTKTCTVLFNSSHGPVVRAFASGAFLLDAQH